MLINIEARFYKICFGTHKI